MMLIMGIETAMVAGIEAGWAKLQLPENQPEDVARAIITCATAGRGKDDRHLGAVEPFWGKIVYVSGGKAYEIEDKLNALEPAWLGNGNSAALAIGQEYLKNGSTSWDTTKSA